MTSKLPIFLRIVAYFHPNVLILSALRIIIVIIHKMCYDILLYGGKNERTD